MTKEGELFDDLPESAPNGAADETPVPQPVDTPVEAATNEYAEAEETEPGETADADTFAAPAGEYADEPEPADEPPPPPPRPATELPPGDSLGAVLAELRRRRGLDIDAVSDATWIKPAYLEALENGDFSDLPQMVYVLAYVKKLCNFYGLSSADTDKLMAGLRDQLSYEIPEDIDKSVVCREQDEGTRKTLHRITVGLVVAAVLLVGLLIFGGTVLVLRLRRPDTATIAPPATLEEGRILALLEKPVLKVTRIP